MGHDYTSKQRQPLISKSVDYGQISDEILHHIERGPNAKWWACILVTGSALLLGMITVAYQIKTGIGTWGLNKTVGWAWDITNFVFWVGIGHAGTLISAILLLFRQKWRTSINRAAEAMTIFAVMCADLSHYSYGASVVAHWMMPFPNVRGPVGKFSQSLVMGCVCHFYLFQCLGSIWYVGMIPDLATLRDRAVGLRKKIYSLLSFGWDGSTRTWHRYEILSLIRRFVYAPCRFSSHHRIHGFCDVSYSRLAYYYFSALLCRRRCFFWFCYGLNSLNYHAQSDEF